MEKIIQFRKKMHQNPELSGQEFETVERISAFMQKFKPDIQLKIGQTALAFVFEGKNAGKTVLLRADIDALPIQEHNSFHYASAKKKVAHLCGHDGHSSILLALAKKLSENRPEKGKVVLLFQPAEETGQGAKELMQNQTFLALKPDFVFGLHNIPGAKRNEVLVRTGSFAAASKGMIVKLTGKTSHAAEPEHGVNPALAVSRIIAQLNDFISDKEKFKSLTLLTIIHVLIGEIAFGTSPANAEMRFTLRAFENADMDFLTRKSEEIIQLNAQKEALEYEIDYTEVFPATVNDRDCTEIIKTSAKAKKMAWRELDKPFKWSEDFAYYTERFKGAFFGLGAGENHSALHNSDYDFPDELISTGADLFYEIIEKVNYNGSLNF